MAESRRCAIGVDIGAGAMKVSVVDDHGRDLAAVSKANALCNDYGLDTIGAGVSDIFSVGGILDLSAGTSAIDFSVLGALDASGQAGRTLVLYTSDHGDNLGARGLWGKSTMYEESAGVPMILSGPGVPQGHTVAEPVSHVDCATTILCAAGAPALPDASGHDLADLARGGQPSRPVPRFRLRWGCRRARASSSTGRCAKHATPSRRATSSSTSPRKTAR